jgi:glycosyltransferase involved in cell wall biosynthesis
MPLVSIVMPAYNRADTIQRAINSVQAQTYQDWELIVVDDGSTDGTATLIEGLDPRMKVIQQENLGFVRARNTGLQASTGEYIAFLDSDDEWLPYHLELSMAFFETFPDEQFVASELLEDFGQGRIVNHYQVETSRWYPQTAKRIRSSRFERPAGSDDDYLRVYESREALGQWGGHILKRAGIDEEGFLYSGRIFEHLRWGYLIAVNSLVLRRTAFETVGLQDPAHNLAADYHFIAHLCRNFRANFIGVPTYIKHELTSDGLLPSSHHIATGATGFICAKDMLGSFDELFWQHRTDDPELRALRGLKQFELAQIAVRFDQRDEALVYLKGARKSGSHVFRALALECFIRCLPRAELARKAYVTLHKSAYASKQVLRGDLSVAMLLRKVLARIRLRTVHDGGVILCLLSSHLLRSFAAAISDNGEAVSAAANLLG